MVDITLPILDLGLCDWLRGNRLRWGHRAEDTRLDMRRREKAVIPRKGWLLTQGPEPRRPWRIVWPVA
ncbi:hypothetical protein CHELA40_12621 [Chelatococcus asaccharovorans]|nr:hypothetical protein CHELA40_12621 [Chelatococcus asaccharovorans]CAH1682137.1 hypothetical protein CHELA17_62994 [Chelatococcus asaccharovorans]